MPFFLVCIKMTYNRFRNLKMLWGLTLWSKEIKKEYAMEEFWNKYIGKHILKGIQVLVNHSENFECVVCPFSRKYNTKGSLSHHLRFDHYQNTVDYIRTNIITKNPDEFGGLLN